jgi:hypothetical protein
LLRLRSFTIGKPVSDEELTGDDAQENITALIEIMEPFVSIDFPDSPLLTSPVFPSKLASLAVLAVLFTHRISAWRRLAGTLFLFVALTGAWARDKHEDLLDLLALLASLALLTADRFSSLG